MSLRRRLLLGILVLLAVGIGVTDAVTYSSLGSFLAGRLDAQLDLAEQQVFDRVWLAYRRAVVARAPLARRDPSAWLAAEVAGVPAASCPALTAATRPVPAAPSPRVLHHPDPFLGVSPDVYLEVFGPGRRLLAVRPSGGCDPAPQLPPRMPVQRVPARPRLGARGTAFLPNQQAFTVPAVGDSSVAYRAEAVELPGGVLVSAVALSSDRATLARVLRIEILVSVGVLVVAAAVALVVTRLALAPLEEMSQTAQAIASGDLGRRVRQHDERSEVGRLGRALNTMLGQIEAAFAERSRSEGRLRRFVADASHELRTPLTTIRGYAELLRKGAYASGAAQAEVAARIEREAARMGVLVDDLLLLARLDQGRALVRQTVDLAEVVRDAAQAVAVASTDHPLEVRCPGPVLIEGDPIRLRQVVDNLLQNAVRHTPPGTPVRLELEQEADQAVLTVADQGPGLAPEDQVWVFERFYRAPASRGTSGAGLGLAIVAALVRAHGGQVGVQSAPGEGCRFTVRLPLHPSVRSGPGADRVG
jgi:two-component system OmpR family sensor kinase